MSFRVAKTLIAFMLLMYRHFVFFDDRDITSIYLAGMT